MNLEPFMFDVEEREVTLTSNGGHPIEGYKAIVAPQKDDQVISVVKDSYKLVSNRELIEPFLEQLERLEVPWKLDTSHSFAALNRMRLQITFPDIYLMDSESRIPLSLYLHNSYDMSEGIRLFWGAIRSVCSNGMVIGELLGKFYARHTSGFDFEEVHLHFHNALEKTTELQQKINELDSVPPTEQLMDDLQSRLGKKRFQQITDPDKAYEQSQWKLLNDITHYISHEVEKPRRADMQMSVSKVFEL